MNRNRHQDLKRFVCNVPANRSNSAKPWNALEMVGWLAAGAAILIALKVFF